MMSEHQAREIAENFIAQRISSFQYDFLGVVKVPRFPNELNVSFNVSSADGVAFEGPVVVIVDESSEQARFFENA